MAPRQLAFRAADEAATERVGEALAATLRPGDLVALSGDLGAGKSVFARAMLRWLAADPGLEVASPTYSLVHVYDDLPLPVAHADFYRLKDPAETAELGLAEALERGAVLVEWPENGDLPAEPTFNVAIGIEGESRTIRIACDAAANRRLSRLGAVIGFLKRNGHDAARRLRLQGDASTRRYEHLETDDRPLILMDAPRQPDGPPIRDGKPYSRLAHLAEDVVPFITVDHWLRGAGLAAPEIVAADADAGLVVIEDLGREGVLDASGAPDPKRYLAAIDVLVELHRQIPPDTIEVGLLSHTVPPYDAEVCLTEVSLFADWFVPFALDRDVPDLRDGFLAAWDKALLNVPASPRVLTLRDYHSPNLIWRGDRTGTDRIGLIDFQDALVGHPAYDVASLCQDARVTVSRELEAQLLDAYRQRSRTPDWPGFSAAYAVLGAQRLTKILGIFVRLFRRDGKPRYLDHMPRLVDYLVRDLEHPALRPVADWHRDNLDMTRLAAAFAVRGHGG